MANKQSKNMQAVKQAFINAGFSENQANMLTAEVGRENAFQDRYLFGTHSDPHNKVTNLGFFSWQGPRGQKLAQYLQSQGLMKDGKIERSQAALDAMARFSRYEMENNPAYSRTNKEFLQNPDVSYEKGNEVLGTDYIRWRYGDGAYKSGHDQRNKYYSELGGVVPEDYVNTGGFSAGGGGANSMTYNIPSLDNFNGYVDNLSQMFGGQANVLGGPLGLNVPQTPSQNDTYGRIADMGYDDPNEEAAYAEAGRALADTRDMMGGQQDRLIQPISPIRTDLEYIFDNIDTEDTA